MTSKQCVVSCDACGILRNPPRVVAGFAVDTGSRMDGSTADAPWRGIAARFLPNRTHYWYVRSKFATDPLYDGVCAALIGMRAPLLDLGCGIGLLAHCLRAKGIDLDYFGVDNDAGKIAAARAAADRAGITAARFECVDLATSFPAHSGNVCLLDVLQYLDEPERSALLEAALERVAPGARLVLRTGVEDGNWRTHVARGVDRAASWARWMNTGPKRYPTRVALESAFARHGMRATWHPSWGRMPFNNWLVVAERR
jgi:SAM-dependent methyltransferase